MEIESRPLPVIGTTRSRVSFFMNRFRKLGFIDYHAGDALQVHSFTSRRCSPRLAPWPSPQTSSHNSDEQIRHLVNLIRRAALFSSRPAPPNRVAVLRTFAEMVTSASETKGCSSASWVKTIAHAVELLNFVQDRIRMHGVHGFPESLTEKELQLG